MRFTTKVSKAQVKMALEPLLQQSPTKGEQSQQKRQSWVKVRKYLSINIFRFELTHSGMRQQLTF